MKTNSQKKIEALEKKGWVKIEPEIDFSYLFELGLNKVAKEAGYFMSELVKESTRNPLGLFSKEVEDARSSFLKQVTPRQDVPDAPNNWPSIFANFPSDKDNNDSTIDKAFEELTYQTIIRICRDVLPAPIAIYQFVEQQLMVVKDTSKYDFTDRELYNKVTCVWEDSYLTLDIERNWGSNNASITVEHNFYSENLRDHAQKALINLGLEINPKSYQIGMLDPEFNLNSFPNYIKEYTKDLEIEMGFKQKDTFPNRFNALIVGAPGKGKTKWSQAYACEVLAPLGYLILVVDYSSLQDIVIPNYIDKVCIVVNDADTLALNREVSKRGETEQILSWLDGTRSTFIKPFLMERRGSVITIMTANSVDNWDEAALRKGRIHSFKMFDGETLSDK